MAVKDGLGPRPVSQTAKRHFLNRLETSSKPWLFLRFCTANCHPARVLLEPAFVLRLQTLTLPAFLHCQLPPCSCRPGAGFRSAPLRSKLESKDRVAGLKHHGSEGRIGPAARIPDCQTSLSEPTRNKLQTLTFPAFLHCQLPPCSCPPGSGFRSAPLRSKLESKDRVAGLKHHGSEGRIGPAARIPDCQTSLSEPTRNQLQTLTFPAFLHCQLPPCSCPPGAGFRSAARSPECQTLLSEPIRN